jgi:perosamine synthetase
MIQVSKPSLGREELNNAIEAVKSSWISSKGKFITEFEEKFAEYCGVKYGIATANGTVALHLALVALNIGKGDEIIVPDLTFIATANVVTYCNAKSVFIDSHPDYWCIDPKKIEEKITTKTKAIIPVHLYGHPCDMDEIMKITKKYGLYVVEDAAEAHGAKYKGKKIGSFGDISCFSFYGNKIITTGEGGMCLTNNQELAERMKILRDHGMNPDKRYWYDIVGFNYRMTNVQAAIGIAQLKKIDEFIKRKRQIARKYSKELKDLEMKGLITSHPEMPWAKNVYWMYSILLEENFRISRDELMHLLKKRDIETRPFFYPIHIMPPYSACKSNINNIAKSISLKGINLPSSSALKDSEIQYVVECLKNNIK